MDHFLQISNMLSILLLLASISAAASDFKPKIYTKEFDNIQKLMYFDDSSVIISQDLKAFFRSKDNGENWEKLNFWEGEENIRPRRLQLVDFDKELGFAFSNGRSHYYTNDHGMSWKKFSVDVDQPVLFSSASVNYVDHKKILFNFQSCQESLQFTQCNSTYYYTKDGLATPPIKVDINDLSDCTFAKTNQYFNAKNDDLIVCKRQEHDVFGSSSSSQLIATTDFFKTVLVPMKDALENANILAITIENSFLVVLVASDVYSRNGMIELYVSKDGMSFRKSYFEEQVRRWALQFLPSTQESLYIAIISSASRERFPTATMYKSDSEGLYFTKMIGDVITMGNVMNTAINIQGVDGSWIVGIQTGFDKTTMMPAFRSKITIDDGLTWRDLKFLDDDQCTEDAGCSVNLVSLQEAVGSGEFVTGPTPGILLGIGIRGEKLPENFSNMNTYMSRDGGASWRKVIDSPSTFSFADFGNIAVCIPFKTEFDESRNMVWKTDSFTYSLDQGKTWSNMKLENQNSIPVMMTTAKDGTSHHMTFLLFDTKSQRYIITSADFSNAFSRKCDKKKDYEVWYARQDPQTKEPVCILGQKQKYNRRKQDADCFASTLYEDLQVISEPCKCTVNDTQCAHGFIQDKQLACVPIPEVIANEVCTGKNLNRKIKVSSRQMILGDNCKGGFSIPKNDYTLDCREIVKEAQRDKIKVFEYAFHESVISYIYLERDLENGGIPDETLLVVTKSLVLYVSYDGGARFVQPPSLSAAQGNIASAFTNPYYPNNVYVVTKDGTTYFSSDRAGTFDTFDSPYTTSYGGAPSYDMSFSKANSSRFIWYYKEDCNSIGDCKVSKAAITNDNGQSFIHMLDNTRKCHFADSIFDSKHYDIRDKRIICETKRPSEPLAKLITSVDYFATDGDVLLDKVIGSTSSGEFFVAATLKEDNSLAAFVSVNGVDFAKVQFPHDIAVTRQTAYTILNVNSKQIFMHVTTNPIEGEQYGALLKGNYNGTMYVTSIRHVNRDDHAYVDFESVEGLEGISLLNVVSNVKEIESKKERDKKLKTLITHNDGATWNPLPAPMVDSKGKKYKCGKDCSLNLHSFTERDDPIRDTFSSGSAMGMLFGLGNVGKELKPLSDPDTALFFTSDAGTTWREIKKGRYMWEFGDQGTILVIVSSSEPTDTLSYSLDEGYTWKDYKFSTSKRVVNDLSTVPSDTARRFMLLVGNDDGSNTALSIDFSRLQDRQCAVDIGDSDKQKDFEYWSPQRPDLKNDKCLFGHEWRYLRRKASSNCFIGAAPLSEGYRHIRNCSCTRNDFECDYNFELASDGTCKLIKGLSSKDNSEICRISPGTLEYWEPTGYRKVPLSTCEGGLELDKWASHPCPGKENDYKKEHDIGVHGGSLFWVIAIPLTAFIASAAFVYDRGIRRNGGFQRFGEIRLDDDDNLQLVEENNTDRVVNKIVMAGVYAFSFLTSVKRKVSAFLRRRVLGVRGENSDAVTSFFNDRIVDNDDDSLFRYADEEDDAREIDSFLENGAENDIGAADDDELNAEDELDDENPHGST